MPSRPLVNFTELRTFAAKKAQAIAISKRMADDQMRTMSGSSAYDKAKKERIRHITMNLYAHHCFGKEDMGKWLLDSIWTDAAQARQWAKDSLHAMSPLERKMVQEDWVPSPGPASGALGDETDSAEESLDEEEKKKPPGKRKKVEKKVKKRKKEPSDDEEPVRPVRDKHYQGHIPASLERRLKRVWVWSPNSNPPRWNTPYLMQGKAANMEDWTADEQAAKSEYLIITGGRGKLLTPGHGPEVAVGGWLNPHTTETPVSEDEVYDVVNMCVRPRTP